MKKTNFFDFIFIFVTVDLRKKNQVLSHFYPSRIHGQPLSALKFHCSFSLLSVDHFLMVFLITHIGAKKNWERQKVLQRLKTCEMLFQCVPLSLTVELGTTTKFAQDTIFN